MDFCLYNYNKNDKFLKGVDDACNRILAKVKENGRTVNNVIYGTSTKDRVPVFSNTTGTITSSDVIISGDDIIADKITVNTIDNSSGEITTSKVITDNIQQSGAIYNITDSEGNIIATFDANGLSTTNVSALNKVIANSFEGNISWNNVTGRPSIVTPDGTTNSTGAHTHTATFSDTTGHTHSVSTTSGNTKVSGSVTTQSSGSHSHTVNTQNIEY